MGNVRELRNVIERACALSRGPQLFVDDALDERPAGGGAAALDIELPFKEAKAKVVDGFERGYIDALLKRHNGNLSAAARAAENRSQTSARAAAQTWSPRVVGVT